MNFALLFAFFAFFTFSNAQINRKIQTKLICDWPRSKYSSILEGGEIITEFQNELFWLFVEEIPIMNQLNQSEIEGNVFKTVEKLLSIHHVNLLKLGLETKSHSVAVQAQYQIAQLSDGFTKCKDQWVDMNGKSICSKTIDKEIASYLEDTNPIKTPIYNGDHIHPLSSLLSNHVIVLYATPGTELFRKYHEVILKFLKTSSNFSYILRVLPQDINEMTTELQGYGVFLDIKNMEYKTLDDRTMQQNKTGDNKNNEQEVIEGFNITKLKERYPGQVNQLSQFKESLLSEEENSAIDVWEMQNLGIQTVQMIIQSADPWEKTKDISWNFPSLVSAISRVKVETKVLNEIDTLQSSVQAGASQILINGKNIELDPYRFNYFTLQKFILDSINNQLLLYHLGLDPAIMRKYDNMYRPKTKKEVNDDFGEDEDDEYPEEETGDVIRLNLLTDNWKEAIFFVNNLEKDTKYKRWSGYLQTLLQPSWQLPSIKKNLYTVVYVINPSTIEGLQILGGIAYYIQMNVPIRFGLIFSDSTLVSLNLTEWNNAGWEKPIVDSNPITTRAFIKIFMLLYTKYPKQVTQTFLLSCQQINELPTVADIIQMAVSATRVSRSVDPAIYEDIETMLNTQDYDERIKAMTSYLIKKGLTSFPLMTLNGLIYPDGSLSNLMNYVGPIMYELQKLIYSGQINDQTDFLDYYSKLPGVYPKYHPQFIQSSEKREYALLLSYTPKMLSSPDYYLENLQFFYNKFPPSEIFLHTYIFYADFNQDQNWFYANQFVTHIFESVHVRAAFVHNSKSTDPIGLFISKAISLAVTHNNHVLGCTAISLLLSDLYNHSKSHIAITMKLVEELFHLRFSLYFNETQLHDFADPKTIYTSPSTPLTFKIESDVTTLFYNGRIIRDLTFLSEGDLALLENSEKIGNLQASKTLSAHRGSHFTTLHFLQYLSYIHTYHTSKASLSLSKQFKHILLHSEPTSKDPNSPVIIVECVVDPLTEFSQRIMGIIETLRSSLKDYVDISLYLNPTREISSFPIKRFYRFVGPKTNNLATFLEPPKKQVLTMGTESPESWIVQTWKTEHDLDNIQMSSDNVLHTGGLVDAVYKLKNIVVQGSCIDLTHGGTPPHGLQLVMKLKNYKTDSLVMQNMAYYQLKGDAGVWNIELAEGRAQELYSIVDSGIIANIHSLSIDDIRKNTVSHTTVIIRDFYSEYDSLYVVKNEGKETESVLEGSENEKQEEEVSSGWFGKMKDSFLGKKQVMTSNETINIFSLASGHLYERFIKIMMMSVVKRTHNPVKFWFVENFFSPAFKSFIPKYAKALKCQVELVTYKWPKWLHPQTEKQRIIWAYKILFLDVLFPLNLKKVIYVDADQVMRTDLKELYEIDMHGAPYAYTPFCDSNKETLGFQFWRKGYWADHLQGRPYHISALYVIDLDVFRRRGVGDILRSTYDTLSRDSNSLSNLDQDLPNYAQNRVPIFSLPQEWLWCESWCSNSTKKLAKTIDLCNNPMYKEPKLDMAKRIISGPLFPESWIELDNAVHEIEMK